MTYLLTYKLSQDHLELFFAAIRSSGGWNNNPTATQFMAAYKRLLLRYEVSASGNCTALDATNILHAVKDTTTINHVNADIDVSDITTIRRYDLNVRLEPQQTDHDYVDAPNFNYLSAYKEAAVGYIAGYVVRMVKQSVTCESCIDALVEKDPNNTKFNSLVRQKNHGELIEASASVYQICQSTEQCLVRMLHSTGGNLPTSSKIVSAILSVVLEEAAKKNAFSSLHDHMFDSSPHKNHLFRLIKCIAKCFLKIRMHHLAKETTAKVRGENIRKILSKTILFKKQ